MPGEWSDRSMDRRAMLATLGVGLTAGCLQLQDPDDGRTVEPSTEGVTVGSTPDTTTRRSSTPTSEQSPEARTTLEPRAPGNIRWRYETETTVAERPVVADRTVYVATKGGRVLALATDTGAERWRYETKIDSENIWHAVAGDHLFVAGSFATEAVRLADGTLSWGTSSGTKYKPLVRDGIAYLGGSTGAGVVRAYDVAADELLWSFRCGSTVRGRPALVDGTLYLTAGSHDGERASPMYAFDARTGEQQWRRTIDDRLPSAVVPYDGRLYVTGDTGTVAAIDPADGSIIWRRSIDGVKGAAGAPDPQFTNGRLYIADRSVRALDPVTGTTHWTYDDRNFYGRLAMADGALYTARDDAIYVLDPATGARRATFELPTGEPTGLTVGPRTLLYGDREGEVVAVWR